MAVAYQSHSVTSWADHGGTMNITAPSGLAEGDLMVAHIVAADRAGSVVTIGTPSGWTNVGSQIDAGGHLRMHIHAKVATAGDVSGGSFNWTPASGEFTAGSLFRITGQGDITSIQKAFAVSNNGGTETFANTVDPLFADNLLLFFVLGRDESSDPGTASVASYAITTSNPTWTERHDTYGDLDSYEGAGNPSDLVFASATATRPEDTATGNSTCNVSISDGESIGAIVVIPPITNVSVSPTVITNTTTIPAPTVTAGASVSPSVVTNTSAVQAPTVTLGDPEWVNVPKS